MRGLVDVVDLWNYRGFKLSDFFFNENPGLIEFRFIDPDFRSFSGLYERPATASQGVRTVLFALREK